MSLIQARKDAVEIFYAGLNAADPVRAVKKHFKRSGDVLSVAGHIYNLDEFLNVYVIGAGKASAAMAQPVEEILGGRITDGIINVKHGYSLSLGRITVQEAGHPIPDEAGLRGAEKIMEMLRSTDERDLVLFLVSGGGSALLPFPVEGLTLDDKKQVTKRLLESGATIHEVNAIRKHVSLIKGGQLARAVFPSALVSLILSDVIGDRLESIASGPAVPDSTTYGDCLRILEKYGIASKIPEAVLDHLEKGARGELPETPKSGDPVFRRTQNVIVGNNTQAVEAAGNKAESLGYNTLVLSSCIEGEAREVARIQAGIAKKILAGGHPVARPACLISGGETTVTIRGKGLGGRNQEYVLAAAIEIDGMNHAIMLSGGTDGIDGPTDAAGAVADGTTIHRARALGLDADKMLQENDSYHFFEPLGDLLITGPTFTNVMDLHIVLVV